MTRASVTGPLAVISETQIEVMEIPKAKKRLTTRIILV